MRSATNASPPRDHAPPSRLAWAGAKRSESGGRLCKQEVTGSIPVGSTRCRYYNDPPANGHLLMSGRSGGASEARTDGRIAFFAELARGVVGRATDGRSGSPRLGHARFSRKRARDRCATRRLVFVRSGHVVLNRRGTCFQWNGTLWATWSGRSGRHPRPARRGVARRRARALGLETLPALGVPDSFDQLLRWLQGGR